MIVTCSQHVRNMLRTRYEHEAHLSQASRLRTRYEHVNDPTALASCEHVEHGHDHVALSRYLAIM